MENQIDYDLKRLNYLLDKMKNQLLPVEEYIELQKLLLNYEYFYRKKYPLCRTTITGDKIMFVADSHKGGKFENDGLVFNTYYLALKQNIHTVVHAGDMLEACCNDYDKPYDAVYLELERSLELMPAEIVTKLLLGNHDYSAVRTYPKLIPYFFNNPKLDILGMYKVLLDWDGQAIIRLEHFVSQISKGDLPGEEKGIIQIDGHHHCFRVDEENRRIDLPPLNSEALSMLDDYFYKRGLKYSPVSIIASREGEHTLVFKLWCIDAERKRRDWRPSETVEVNTETKQLKFYKS